MELCILNLSQTSVPLMPWASICSWHEYNSYVEILKFSNQCHSLEDFSWLEFPCLLILIASFLFCSHRLPGTAGWGLCKRLLNVSSGVVLRKPSGLQHTFQENQRGVGQEILPTPKVQMHRNHHIFNDHYFWMQREAVTGEELP